MVYYLDVMNEKLRKKTEAFFLQFPLINLKKGETVVEADRDLNEVYYLKKGFIREYTFSSQGVELTLHVFAPGSYFPMVDVLAGVKNRYYYETLTPVELYITSIEKMLKFFRGEPDLVLDLTRRLLLGLDKLLTRIEFLVFGKAETRVVSALLFLARHFGRQKNKEVQIQYLFTHKDIASFAGISRETASREIEKLVRKKVIEYKNHLLLIKNLETLKKQGGM